MTAAVKPYSIYSVVREAVPDDSLLRTYRGGAQPSRWEKYRDCFSLIADREVSLNDFVFAFYTSSVFRIERLLLGAVAGAPSSNADARAVADGSRASFAVWYVGERTATQLLMCDRYERTRSWFRVAPLDGGSTLLQFGSAVAASRGSRSESAARRLGFRLLLGFHVLYSQALLRAARVEIMKAPAN